ncbi:MAG: TolC family protein [Rickettsiales bacterium]|nr:TolC family protein [Rickettsiales bacterium]
MKVVRVRLLAYLFFVAAVLGGGRFWPWVVSVAAASAGETASGDGPVAEDVIPINIAKLFELVRKNNASVIVSRLEAQRASREVDANFSKFLPTVVLDAGYNKTFGKNIYVESEGKEIDLAGKKNYSSDTEDAEIRAGYNVFNSGRDLLSYRATRHAAEAIGHENSAKTESALFEAVKLYFHILLLETQRKSKLDEQSARAELRRMAESKRKLGSLSPEDKLKVENSYLEAKISVASQDKLIRERYIELNQNHLGLRPDQHLLLEKPGAAAQHGTGKINVDRQISYAIANDAQLKKLTKESKQLGEKMKLAKMAMIPTITVDLSAGISAKSFNLMNEQTKQSSKQSKDAIATAALDARINFPIFSGFKDLNNLKAIQKGLESHEALIEERKKVIQSSIVRVVGNINYYREMIPSLEENFRLQAEIVRGVLNSYRNGGNTMKDVLLEKSSLERVGSELLAERYNLLISRLELLKLTGKLTVENIINLGGFDYE